MTKRVLFVSIAFPPKGDPECIQTGRYFYHLSLNKELSIDVVTSKSPTLFMPVDTTLSKYANVTGQLIEIPVYETKYSNYLLRKFIPATIARPDSKMTFHWQWKKIIKDLKTPPDVIYSRSFPLSSAIMALKLARYFNVPWFMHLSDPWTENALHPFSPEELDYHAGMEMECFEKASVISFTSDKTSDLYQNKYPKWAGKMKVFPNVYDPEDRLIPEVKTLHSSGKKKIVYTGGLANTRTAFSLLQALDLMLQRSPALSSRVEVLFAGDRDRKNHELFSRYALPCVKHIGLISAAEAKMLQDSADLLVVIDSKISHPDKAVFFPSKLLDYSILNKPILAITDAGSTTDDFVCRHGGVTFSHDAFDELSDWLQAFIENRLTLSMKEIESTYAANKQALRLANVFQTL